MKYRAEIDGLRALAVVPVILFHAGFEIFSGGFVGVDVFFVISGYLITSILISDIENQRFSIINFYERRARRILPALLFVILACIPFAWMWMLPNQLKDFSQSLVAVSLFVSNILFWQESGYFDTATEEKPLLHTWSLAVEEQYYLLFPIFLIFAWRFGRNKAFWMIVIMAAISLLVSEWGWRNEATANFYLAPTRAWELFAGSIAAFVVYKRGVQYNNSLALLGLVAIVFSIFIYDENTPFPSVYTLLPVSGVVLLILYGDKETMAARLLSMKAFVGVGLISYSAYLWHQPLFAFAKIRLSENLSHTLMLTLSLVSIVLAFFSWRYIEKPFRYSMKSRRLVLVASVFALAIPLTIGFILYSKALKETPSGNKLTGIACASFPEHGDATCINSSRENANFTVVLWGDSHSLALRKDVIIPSDINIISIGHAGCAPLIGLYRFDGEGNWQNCDNSEVILNYANYINDINPDLVILIGRWPLYFNGLEREGVSQSAHHLLTNSDENISAVLSSDSFRRDLLLSKLKETVNFLSAEKVFVLVSPPDLADIGLTRQNLNKKIIPYTKIESYNSAIKYITDEKNALNVLDSKELFCTDGMCQLTRNGFPLYDDDNHVSYLGSRIIWQNLLVEKAFKNHNNNNL